jgi:hypothetical protein
VDFLVFLFEVKGLASSTVKGYISAISRTIHISGGVVGFQISTKNTNLVEDHPVNISGKFG